MNEFEKKVDVEQYVSAVPPDIADKHVKTYGVSDHEKLQRSLKAGKIKQLVLDVDAFAKDDPNTLFLPDPDLPTAQPHLKVINVNSTYREDGVSPLHLAAWMGDVRLLHYLLQHTGSEIDCSTKSGNTPLMEALATDKGDRSACINLLLKFGASVVQPNEVGHSAVSLAAMMGDNKVLTKMLERTGAIDCPEYTTKTGQTTLMLALSRGHVATGELLLEAAGSSTGRWMTLMDDNRLSALCWSVLLHPNTAAPYIALRMAEAHTLQKFLRNRLDHLHLTPNDELLFHVLYKETLLLMMLRSPYTWLLNLHVLEHLYSNALWETSSTCIISHEAFKKHPQESTLMRQLPWLVAMLMGMVADIPGISLTFLAHPSASTDFIGLLEKIINEKHNKCLILSDKPVHFLLLPFLKAPQTCQWIRDELFNNTKILVHLAVEPNSLNSMAQSIAEFFKAVFSSYKFKAASGVLGKDLIKKHLIKVDEETIHKRLEKPWKQLEKCAAKSRTILMEKGMLHEEHVEKAQVEEMAKKEIPKKKNRPESKKDVPTKNNPKNNSGKQMNKWNKEKSCNLKIVSSTHNKPQKTRNPQFEDSAILASAVLHSKNNPVASQNTTPGLWDLPTQNAHIESFLSEMNKMQEQNAFQNYGLWDKSEKDIANQMVKGWPMLQEHPNDAMKQSSALPHPSNEWLKSTDHNGPNVQQSYSSLFSTEPLPVPPLPEYNPESTQQHSGPSYRDVVSGNPTANQMYMQGLHTPNSTGSDCSDSVYDQQKVDDSSDSNKETESFFPSAYDEPDPLECLESFLRRPSDHGDTDQRPNSLPSGIEQTYEYDDYRQESVQSPTASKSMSQTVSDDGQLDCSSSPVASQSSSQEHLDHVYESNEDDYPDYYRDYSNESTQNQESGMNAAAIPDEANANGYSEYCPDYSQQSTHQEQAIPVVSENDCYHDHSQQSAQNPESNVNDSGNPAAANVEQTGLDGCQQTAQPSGQVGTSGQCAPAEECPDEFQWNWVPKSKRWREQLKKLVNSNASDHQKQNETYYLSFSDESMLVGESKRSKVTVGIHRDGTEVALKRIPRCLLSSKAPNPSDQLPDHINITNYKDWSVDEHYVYLARELCDYSLAEYVCAAEAMMVDSTIPSKQAVGVAIVAALGALHVCGRIHGNLKPQNVLLAPSGRVVLVDAGKWYADQDTDTENGWIAPDMLQTQPPPPPCDTPASDVFVAGLLTFYLLTGGEHPYGNGPPDLQRANVASGALKVFHGQLADPMELDLILACMLVRKTPERATAEQCLRHAYFWDEDKKFDFLSKFAAQPEVKNDLPCSVTTPINSAQQWIGCNNWYDEMSRDMRKLADKLRFRGSTSVTSLLCFIAEATKTHNTWPAALRRRVPSPKRFFLRQYPKLLMPVYEICRESPWRKRDAFKCFFC